MKHMLLLATLWLALATPALADKLSIAEINAYFNSFTTARADFTQVNGDGSVSTGQLSLRRPGRARFDYNEDEALVIAGGGQVAIFDPVSNTPPEQYPLRRTPLAHILAATVNLGASGMLVAHDYDGTATSVVVQDPEHPEYGSLRLIFTDAPVALRQWVIVNDAGGETTVVLDGLAKDVRVAARDFSIPQEIAQRGLN